MPPLSPQEVYQALVSDAVNRGGADDWFRLGHMCHENHWFAAAAGHFARSVQKNPDNLYAVANWGWNLHLSGHPEDAREKLSAAIGGGLSEGRVHALYSQVLRSLGDDDAAVRQGREAIRVDPQLPLAHVAASFALMTAGEWLEGLTEYEHRFFEEIPEFRTRPFQLWRGEMVGHLYIEAEQGLGDTIMALRWLQEACSRAERVTFYVQTPLYSLVRRAFDLPENCTVYPLPRPLPGEVDAWSPTMSLPVALEMREPFVPAVPYLSPTSAPASPSERFRVGIAWAGSPTHKAAHWRDVPLVHWLRLADVPGVELHSLQIGDAALQQTQLATFGLIEDRSSEIASMLDTAEIVAGLDVVICVDTSVAHLAGAMGKPVWLLANRMQSDFRWGRGEGTRWYPSMRIFWRGIDERWDDVLRRVEHDLRNTVT